MHWNLALSAGKKLLKRQVPSSRARLAAAILSASVVTIRRLSWSPSKIEFQSGAHIAGGRPGGHFERGLDRCPDIVHAAKVVKPTTLPHLCRRLGVAMLGISDAGEVSVIVGSVSPMPRTDTKRRSRLMREHQKRRGDPVLGGSSRTPIMTAYRQRALACAATLTAGPLRVRDIRTNAPDAGKILLSNV
jgi:hypothetical protein